MDGETKTQSGLWGTSLGIVWLRLQASNAESVDLTPGQGTKFPYVSKSGRKKKKRERKWTVGNVSSENSCPVRAETQKQQQEV